MYKLYACVIVLLWVMVSCKPKVPGEYIQPDEMEDILVDYHMARAMADRTTDLHERRNYNEALYIEAVMRKHGVSKAEFDSSLVYYYRRADRFADIYKRVSERLDEQALLLGATEGEIGMYSSITSSGDTANIWAERTELAMMPIPPFNRWDFEQEVDSTFKEGDGFLLQFLADYMYQDGSRDGVACLAITYDNDTTISRHISFSSGGLLKLHHDARERHRIKRIRGFFYLGSSGERSTTTRILFLSNIQLIRFHQKKENMHENVEESGVKPDSVGERNGRETVSSGDIQRGSGEVLSVDTGTAKHRMVKRPLVPAVR